jgi:superoxide dismutase|tara:strand:- start:190 stop:486 length:297 start_codon:yes stop_codon:yes gene_type:complete
MKTITLRLPDFWATALFNDDTSGFEYEDEKPFQEFCEWMVKNYGTSEPVAMLEDPHFMKYHDASQFGVLACDVHEYTFYENYGNPKTSAMTTLAHTMK